MDEEIASHRENRTWSRTTRAALGKDVKIVSSKWVFSTKELGNGGVRYKARLCARGFNQKKGKDYQETYSPTASADSVRLLFAEATVRDLEVQALDVKCAYLHGDLDVTIGMEAPEGYEGGQILRLHKSIYGLKQSGRQWFKKLTDYLTNEGKFAQCVKDPCIFRKQSDDSTIVVLVYVDDFLITGKGQKLQETINSLDEKFALRNLGEIKSFLGLKITRTTDTLTLSQPDYTRKILKRFQMDTPKSKPHRPP